MAELESSSPVTPYSPGAGFTAVTDSEAIAAAPAAEPLVQEGEPAPSAEVTAAALLSSLAGAQIAGLRDAAALQGYLNKFVAASPAERAVAERFGATQLIYDALAQPGSSTAAASAIAQSVKGDLATAAHVRETGCLPLLVQLLAAPEAPGCEPACRALLE